MTEPPSDTDGIARRSVLRNGAIAAGVLAVGGAAAAGSAAAGRRGGRGLLEGNVRRNSPFTVTREGSEELDASCMSDQSAEQTYYRYTVDYCESNTVNPDCVLYVHPDEAEVDPTGVYEIRSVQPCRGENLAKVAFGPSNEPCR